MAVAILLIERVKAGDAFGGILCWSQGPPPAGQPEAIKARPAITIPDIDLNLNKGHKVALILKVIGQQCFCKSTIRRSNHTRMFHTPTPPTTQQVVSFSPFARLHTRDINFVVTAVMGAAFRCDARAGGAGRNHLYGLLNWRGVVPSRSGRSSVTLDEPISCTAKLVTAAQAELLASAGEITVSFDSGESATGEAVTGEFTVTLARTEVDKEVGMDFAISFQMSNVLIAKGAHTKFFGSLLKTLQVYVRTEYAGRLGVSPDSIDELAALHLRTGKAAPFSTIAEDDYRYYIGGAHTKRPLDQASLDKGESSWLVIAFNQPIGCLSAFQMAITAATPPGISWRSVFFVGSSYVSLSPHKDSAIASGPSWSVGYWPNQPLNNAKDQIQIIGNFIPGALFRRTSVAATKAYVEVQMAKGSIGLGSLAKMPAAALAGQAGKAMAMTLSVI